MFGFLRKKTIHQASINGHAIEVNSKETVLSAALQQGVAMAHSCRVGGCGTCKCQLLEGKVKELTDFSYILSEQELENNYILACQSVAQTDIKISAKLNQSVDAVQECHGRVVAQQALTHDITRLTVRMDTSLNYKAGQYAEIAIESLPNVFRNYSFASMPSSEANLEFFVRLVENGIFSTQVNHSNVIGQKVTVRGPLGDFHLRPSSAPLLLIAGGSGLAPIFSILEDGLAQQLKRDAVLLFGARTEHDLYLLEDIKQIAKQWHGSFSFIPVLSDENNQEWQGARGYVTAHIQNVLTPDTHAYLCGPPAMVDAASHLLKEHNIKPEHIHADRFLVQQNAIAI